jgi:hypothetical protein
MTEPTRILMPMMALIALTFVVLLLIPYQRFKAGRQGRVTAHDFRYGESSRVPPEVSLPNRNLMNLLEMPLLFYVACVTAYVTHSAIHLTYNRVFHRLTAYAASNVVLAIMWLRLFQALASSGSGS